MLPGENREEVYKQFYGDLMAMPPSELLRTLYSLDCLRGGMALGWRSKKQIESRTHFDGERELTTSDWESLLEAKTIHEGFYDRLKRAIDVFVAAVFLMSVVPLLIFVTLAIKIESGGPVFYRQERVGRNGKTFDVVKFRSMGISRKRGMEVLHTRVGRFLRRTSLDEIPQFLNVLRGDMSLVGPRPERPTFAKYLGKEILHYKLRQSVRPGITGWAQVHDRYVAETIEDMEGKVFNDIYYAKHRSFWLDLRILVKTFRIIMSARES